MKRFKVIACEIAMRELCFCASQCAPIVDLTFMPFGLHGSGAPNMKATLQAEIDKVDSTQYDAILLAYGLCGSGVVGLHAPIPLVILKAHDCTTFLLGSKEKYTEFFFNNRGTFIYSPGWVERMLNQDGNEKHPNMEVMGKTFAEYVEQYDEETAKYLWDVMGGSETAYKQIAFINTKVGNVEYYREKLHEKAKRSNWTPIEVDGDTSLLLRFLNGDWNDNDFTVIPPHHSIEATNDETIIGYTV